MTLFIHGSPPPELPFGTGVSVTGEEDNASGVSVGRGVFVNVAVGGIGVAVGMAAWVSAIIVKATAAAVLCRSSALSVGGGVACAPHALMISVNMTIRVRLEEYFM
jgi:hypothetical protein